MKIIKRVSLSIIAIAIIVGIVFVLLKMREEKRMLEVVKSGQVVIDQVMHYWNVCKKNSPVRIEMYIRNNSDHIITGNLVFLVNLSRKGLEEKFIRAVIECEGDEERLKREMKEHLDAKGSLGRAEPIYNYLIRGKKLLPGQKYEPSTEIADSDYSFRFRQKIFLNRGELIKIDHEEQIPFNERGNLLSVKIENIEF